MSSITKEVKCNTCGSYIHDTLKCNVWYNRLFCRIDKIYKKECSCERCKNRCKYCNNYLNYNNECLVGHNGVRCSECNEFLCNYECRFDHTKPFCKFCNLPVYNIYGTCVNFHMENDPICFQCKMPEDPCNKHQHDGIKCKICDTLLENGKCIYNCVDGGNFCISCNSKGVVHNYCFLCGKDNTGQFTKRANK